MDNQNEELDQSPEDLAKEERKLLMEQARQMGITFSPNIGLEKLRAKIHAHINDLPDPDSGAIPEARPGETEQQRKARIRKDLHDTQMKLVRCRITNHNPAKANLPGEFIFVGNRYLGMVKKFIPFGEAGLDYHVPYIIYTELLNRQYNHVTTTKGKYNVPVPVQKLVPEYSITVLEQHTPETLAKLAADQAARGAIDREVNQGAGAISA